LPSCLSLTYLFSLSLSPLSLTYNDDEHGQQNDTNDPRSNDDENDNQQHDNQQHCSIKEEEEDISKTNKK